MTRVEAWTKFDETMRQSDLSYSEKVEAFNLVWHVAFREGEIFGRSR